MLLHTLHTVSLASYSQALTCYDTSCMNQLGLAGFAGLGYLAAQAFDTLHIQPEQTLRFYNQQWESNPLPTLYQCVALPMSYVCNLP